MPQIYRQYRDIDVQQYAQEISLDRDQPTVFLNMASSLDGRATIDGTSTLLGGPADQAIFHRLRALCDCLIVGEQTVNLEGYQDIIQSTEIEDQRQARGQSREPTTALISEHLDINWQIPLFTKGEGRVIIYTSSDQSLPETNTPSEKYQFAAGINLPEMVADLQRRGMNKILCEGGPTLNGYMQADDLIDEFFLTIDLRMVGGQGINIVNGHLPQFRPFQVENIFLSDQEMCLHLRRRTD